MKRTLLIIFLVFICTSVFSQQSFNLSGIVKDKRGDGLPGAGVYVSGYKIATVTDNNGRYSLKLKPGNYDILIQIIGYKALNKNIIVDDKAITLDALLEEDAVQLNEVTIKPDPNREGYIRMFFDFFVGTTPNAAQCKIINPNVLIIDYSTDDSKLTVKTNQFLIIENQALGYRIKYMLNNFEFDNKSRIIYYEGYPYYEDLKGSKGKIKRWATKRAEAYSGSTQHFFSSLYAGKSKEEGFIMNKLIKQVDKTRPADSVIKSNIQRLTSAKLSSTGAIKITNGDSLSYWINQKNKPKEISILNQQELLPDTLVKVYNESIKSINFTDILYVIYTKEKEAASYANRIGLSISRPLKMNDYQISLINLLVAPVYFYQNGGTYNPRSMLFQGYWSWEKIADSVPLDYVVPKVNPSK
ncbi:carboxypeptidase-like regulatory domain-containing protein [Pedobacter jejuensis]|uniref:Carboxypeptidase-like regulatory domain-containing protein n=1 Tax=Pedobacter jejuensis TaxID=1268550 RepID=A0A3N0BRR9_9SPHI|nr:carboxypeptidase-like regulatory domain-containing protein [Pedobacter jejuensis]RNL51706.1 carboxypeptidase-like regulatory domain-containing protein [Pedobacter jejuensis]